MNGITFVYRKDGTRRNSDELQNIELTWDDFEEIKELWKSCVTQHASTIHMWQD